jgi:hypothetical protein
MVHQLLNSHATVSLCSWLWSTNYNNSAVIFCRQVAVHDFYMASKIYYVTINKILTNSTTKEAKEKITTDLEMC